MTPLQAAEAKRKRKAARKNPSKYAAWNVTKEADEARKDWNDRRVVPLDDDFEEDGPEAVAEEEQDCCPSDAKDSEEPEQVQGETGPQG